MKSYARLVERGSGRVVVERLRIADGYWSRLRGLQLQAEPAAGFGLLLIPCPSVHTLMMRFPIDVVMLDRGGLVVDTRRNVRPWRVVIPTVSTFAILEIPSRSAERPINVGTSLRLELPRDDPRRKQEFYQSWQA